MGWIFHQLVARLSTGILTVRSGSGPDCSTTLHGDQSRTMGPPAVLGPAAALESAPVAALCTHAQRRMMLRLSNVDGLHKTHLNTEIETTQ